MPSALTIGSIGVGLPGLATAGHLGMLGAASWFYREQLGQEKELRFLVLVPAHNEEAVLARGLRSIRNDLRPRDMLLVVADRCTDRTAEIAREHGAFVLERGIDEEPGRAAARQAGLEWARSRDWDAVLMLDADSVIDPGFFTACEQALATGAPAVQARSESSRGGSLAAEASVAAFTLQGITVPRGRDRLGLSVRLRGTGMAITRDLALAHRFQAPASEDLFFTLDLMLDGVRCRHVDTARLNSDGTSSWDAFEKQKVRYEAGRMSAARKYVPLLLRRAVQQGDLACLEAAWFLATPPYAIAALLLAVATAGAATAHAWAVAAMFGGGLGVLVLTLITGLIQSRARARTWLALGCAPWYVVFKANVQVRAILSLARRQRVYGPTVRT